MVDVATMLQIWGIYSAIRTTPAVLSAQKLSINAAMASARIIVNGTVTMVNITVFQRDF